MKTAMQELKEKLQVVVNDLSDVLPNTDQYGYRAAMQNVIKDIDCQMLSIEQKQIAVWINVKNSLPDVGIMGCVTVLCLVKEMNHYILDYVDDAGQKYFYLNQPGRFENWTQHVTHWQYLQPL